MATKSVSIPPAAGRGRPIVYRDHETDCPGCGRAHWHVGRITAECAFCATALPLETISAGQVVRIVHMRAA